jgi:hypothetical protein
MAAVVIASEEQRHFSTTALRRSSSAPKFGSVQTTFRSSSSASRIADLEYQQPIQVFSDSAPTSPPPSPQTVSTNSADLSPKSKPAGDFPLAATFADLDLVRDIQAEDQFTLPQYGSESYFANRIPTGGDLRAAYVSSGENLTPTETSRPETPDLCFEHADDDTAVRAQPSRHVDYLSHNWKEEDIWESWKYIVSRRGDYSNGARLENASWRTWMKSKNNLKTVSPETLNW